jgi:hypothetical protein
MKKLLLYLPALFSTFLCGCIDLEKISQNIEKKEKMIPQPPPEVYPVHRTITDNQGRTLSATILGKQALQIAFAKNPEGTKFIVPMDRLSPDDQTFFRTLPDGGKFAMVEKQISLKGRLASWHGDWGLAKNESVKLDLPIFVVTLITDHPQSQSLEKSLVYSQELRDWASQNVVLCLLKVDDPTTRKKTSFDAAKKREEAMALGINDFTTPSALVIKPGGTIIRLNTTDLTEPKSAIRMIERVIQPGYQVPKNKSNITTVPSQPVNGNMVR